MQAKDTHLLRFIGQGSFSFVIPVYQRNYDWSVEQCEQLTNDLELIIRNNLKSYFLGSIVYISENQSVSLSNVNKILIIDGQQRLTTISLLLIAIANKIQDEQKKQMILDQFIMNQLAKGEEKIKLKPIKDDRVALNSIIQGNEAIEGNSVTINYNFFEEYVANTKYSPDELFEAIGKLKIVDISLDYGIDDPQLIFESLNSTGLDLSQSDLIRNFILMNQSIAEQEVLYTKYWKLIEKNCLHRTDDFIRHFITLKESYIPNRDKIYKSFKTYRLNNSNLSIQSILEEILQFSKFYFQFESGTDVDSKIADILTRLKRLDNSVTYPFLLDLFHDYSTNKLSGDQVIYSLKLVENYIVRRFICDVPTNAMNKIFATLARDIKRLGDDWGSRYEDYLNFLIGSKKASGRFPRNTELCDALLSKDIYHMKPKNKIFLLESLENFNNKEKIDVMTALEKNEISVEHIMPQKLTPEWHNELGKDFKEIHEAYLNTIGNISLTGYNSNLQNKPFTEKKKIGFSDSRFWLNTFVKSQEKWDKQAILKRTEILTEKFMNIWPEINIPDISIPDLDEEVSILEDYTFTNRQVRAVIIKGNRYPISTFRELKIVVLGYLYKVNSSLLYQIQQDENLGKILVANTPQDMSSAQEISKGVFTEVHMSAQSIIRSLRKVATHFKFEDDDLIVVLSSTDNVLAN